MTLESCVRFCTSLGFIYFTCKRSEAVTLQGCCKSITDWVMGKYDGSMHSRRSAFRANLHTGKGIVFPIPSADLTGMPCRPCPGYSLVLFCFILLFFFLALIHNLIGVQVWVPYFCCSRAHCPGVRVFCSKAWTCRSSSAGQVFTSWCL